MHRCELEGIAAPGDQERERSSRATPSGSGLIRLVLGELRLPHLDNPSCQVLYLIVGMLAKVSNGDADARRIEQIARARRRRQLTKHLQRALAPVTLLEPRPEADLVIAQEESGR